MGLVATDLRDRTKPGGRFQNLPLNRRQHASHNKTGAPTTKATIPETRNASTTYERSSKPSHVSGEDHR